tara:strand:+ start:606 stop:1061 length:456 start_codon:yes stop_codon:yes gene_type:complete
MRSFNAKQIKFTLYLASVYLLAISVSAGTAAKVLPDPMVSNLFALTDVAASLQICSNSKAYASLTESDKNSIQRLMRNIDKLIMTMAETYDPSLIKFYLAQRSELSESPAKLNEMRQRYGYCGNGMIADIRRYVYTSKKTLDEFFKAYNRR